VVKTERVSMEDWAISHDGSLSIAIDPTLDDALLLEGRALDLIREVNELRKTSGLALTDRIDLVVPPAMADIIAGHRDWIAAEVLAQEIAVDASAERPSIS